MNLLTPYSLTALLAVASLADMLQVQEEKDSNSSVSILEKRTFPYFAYFMTSIRSVIAYFNVPEPITVKLVWWEALVAGDGSLIDMVTYIENACRSCMLNHKYAPVGSCKDDTTATVKSILQNSLIGFIGWYLPKLIAFIPNLNRSDKKYPNPLVSFLEKGAFMLYTYALAGIKKLFGYFTRPLPIWVKTGWWAAFVIADGIIFGRATQIENAYNSCGVKYKDLPGGSCQDDILIVVHGIVEIFVLAVMVRNLPKLIDLIRKKYRTSHGAAK
ncbi:uncharacterized protein NDAI_0H04040 [Naumovozyma dairenensis CBS 421]|uniref:Transmembrane protein n=1 Tax=Naumovozyma dairenensis (strain ATCC 10597 / BCRC 20456 / CBS 421 / NBRC 0211 / NRRL Y-12639) TaxID=1071378 RepID=G0WFL6_NAUDC|nr:hypothetical protein NDAI_0H04040 [Naumovozyma dairenensis CBS 421]CCD26577.1 hypothetical protein NDAI_0H04040 [Naumovozyma dairenensis CBS 421]